MAARAIASLTLSFGLVSIPVKLYSATESSAGVRFNLLSKDGERLKQQYVSERDGRVVERGEMARGYEFEKDRFVLFTADELKALQESPSQSIDIVAFLPERAVDPLYYDKAYFLAPDKRGGKPYALLRAALQESGRCALAKWAWKGKLHMVQVRPDGEGLVLQQLLYADEVRSISDLDVERVDVSQGELKLALQFIDQLAEEAYDPAAYEDEEKKRILAAIDEKITGQEVVAPSAAEPAAGAQVIDLMEALKASLSQAGKGDRTGKTVRASPGKPDLRRVSADLQTPLAAPAAAPASTGVRKGVRRAAKADDAVARKAEPKAGRKVAEPADEDAAPVRARGRR